MRDFDRIALRPGLMGGKACIRGMRVTVGMIVGQIGSGRSIGWLLGDYPYLEREDILQAVRYAARVRAEIAGTKLHHARPGVVRGRH
jgi:uncharacterized protein (DUF433 family)